MPDEPADRLAAVFQNWLQRHYPEFDWKRVRGIKEWPQSRQPSSLEPGATESDQA